MRKIVAIAFLIVIGGGVLHAQLPSGLGIGGWARFVFSPIGGSGTFGEGFSGWDNMFVRNQSNQNWLFPTRGKVGLATWGNSDFLGFNFDFAYEDGAIRVGDQAKVWVRPHHSVMLHFGRTEGNRLRSEIRGGRLTFTEEENDIFTRFNPRAGMLVDWDPIDNLYIGFSLDVPRGTEASFRDAFHWDSEHTTYQIGVGYRFSFGHLRAQLIATSTDVWQGKPLQVAFAYDAIHNVLIDGGILFPLNPQPFSPAKATIAAQWQDQRWDIMGRGTIVWYPETPRAGTRLKLGAVVKYTINFPLFVGVELAYISDYHPYNQMRDWLPPIDGNADLFQICPFVGFRFGRGEFRIGFFWEQNFRGGEGRNFRFEVPMMLEVNFF